MFLICSVWGFFRNNARKILFQFYRLQRSARWLFWFYFFIFFWFPFVILRINDHYFIIIILFFWNCRWFLYRILNSLMLFWLRLGLCFINLHDFIFFLGLKNLHLNRGLNNFRIIDIDNLVIFIARWAVSFLCQSFRIVDYHFLVRIFFNCFASC